MAASTPKQGGRADPSETLAALDRALAREPRNPLLWLRRAESLLGQGRRADALAAADAAAGCAGGDARLWDALGTLRTYARDERGALAAYERAVALAPGAAHFLFNRAAVRRFVGDLEGAEADYDAVIALKPADDEAYLNRSQLRPQTAERNHIAELEARAVAADAAADAAAAAGAGAAAAPGAAAPPGVAGAPGAAGAPGVAGAPEAAAWRGAVQIRYALAKEYEDLGEYARSFANLRRGAQRRRAHLRYDLELDLATVGWIASAFPAGPPDVLVGARDGLAGSRDVPGDAAEESPIFIVGLPRTGSTLIERILGRHSALSSAGELDCFALALTDAVTRLARGAPLNRQQRVARSALIDFPALGRDYLLRARSASGVVGRFIDKMPLNYLYCGLIRRALPHARIVHVMRHPMSVGYALYKTLFRDGYPFSYDLTEIGRYIIGYRQLMRHWESTMPGVIHGIHYEALIADPERETRRLLEYCGLDWQSECAEFHLNPEPSTTASAAQIRRPMYDSSVSQWRHYAAELAPLRETLLAGGLDPKEIA